MECHSRLRKHFATKITRAFALLLLIAPAVTGAPITYVFSGPASGTLGTTPFTGAQITVTGTADTANVTTTFPNLPCIDLTSVTINIAGVGSATATGPNKLFDNPFPVLVWGLTNGSCGISGGADWLDVANPLAANWRLVTPIGPTTGVAVAGFQVATTAGTLTLTYPAVPTTFQAFFPAAAPVPAMSPWTLVLLALTLNSMALVFLRRRTSSTW
jgi:hypothetical protein